LSTETNGRPTGVETTDHTFWRDHSTIVLSPVAAPSILGLFGFAAATFMVAANMAGWYGNADTPLILFPFALTAGGIAQFLAGMWAYRARDAVATAIHGIWGSFWIAYGLYSLLIALAVLPSATAGGTAAGAFGFWFVVLAAITWAGAFAAAAENTTLAGVLVMLAAGSTLLAIALLAATPTVLVIGAYLLIISALLAWYLAAAMMLEAAFERAVLPTGKRRIAQLSDVLSSNPIQYAAGEPGVKVGQ
jgi:succinate-acetate transporter protein